MEQNHGTTLWTLVISGIAHKVSWLALGCHCREVKTTCRDLFSPKTLQLKQWNKKTAKNKLPLLPFLFFTSSSNTAPFQPRSQHCRVNTLPHTHIHTPDATGQAAYSLILLSLHIKDAHSQRPAGGSNGCKLVLHKDHTHTNTHTYIHTQRENSSYTNGVLFVPELDFFLIT